MPEKQTESYNSQIAHSVKSAFAPSWLEILIYVLSSTVVLCLLNYRAFTNGIGNSSGLTADTVNGYLHDKLNGASDFISRLLQGRVSSILFWAFLGSLIYMGIWVVQNLFINIENDLQAGEFVSDKNLRSTKKAYWHSVISSKVFFVCALLVMIIYAVVLLSFFLPLTSKTFGLAITDFHAVKSTLSIILSVAATAFLLYLMVFSVRTLVRSWRWIIGNF